MYKMARQSWLIVGTILVFLYAQPVTAIQPSNTTSKEDIVSCVYPVSGQYGLTSRCLVYVWLIIAIWLHHIQWLAVGALASAILSTSTTVVHAAVIVFQGLSPQVLDLDLLAILALLLPSMCLFAVMMNYSVMLSKSSARPLVVCWGVLIWIGLLICLLGLANLNSGPNPAYPIRSWGSRHQSQSRFRSFVV